MYLEILIDNVQRFCDEERAQHFHFIGFESCIANTSPSGEEPTFPFPNRDPNEPELCLPHLDYLAPEYFLTLKCGPNRYIACEPDIAV